MLQIPLRPISATSSFQPHEHIYFHSSCASSQRSLATLIHTFPTIYTCESSAVSVCRPSKLAPTLHTNPPLAGTSKKNRSQDTDDSSSEASFSTLNRSGSPSASVTQLTVRSVLSLAESSMPEQSAASRPSTPTTTKTPAEPRSLKVSRPCSLPASVLDHV